jgi:hypothetical protein
MYGSLPGRLANPTAVPIYQQDPLLEGEMNSPFRAMRIRRRGRRNGGKQILRWLRVFRRLDMLQFAIASLVPGTAGITHAASLPHLGA